MNDLDLSLEPVRYPEGALIRIVEIRSHPLGLEGLMMIAVLEVVSKNIEIESFRCLCLNVEKIVQAVGHLSENDESIEVMDAMVGNNCFF